jgi:hypothetical protein
MSTVHILIFEDDFKSRRLLHDPLTAVGFKMSEVVCAQTVIQ